MEGKDFLSTFVSVLGKLLLAIKRTRMKKEELLIQGETLEASQTGMLEVEMFLHENYMFHITKSFQSRRLEGGMREVSQTYLPACKPFVQGHSRRFREVFNKNRKNSLGECF